MQQLAFFDDMDYTPIKPAENPFDKEPDEHMKHSKYIMLAPWDIPITIRMQSPIAWDKDGKPTMFVKKPVHISSHPTVPDSTAEGFIVCIRKMELDPMKN